MNPLSAYLILASCLFAIGLAGALTRRNAILVLIGIELMLNAANLALVAFTRVYMLLEGQIFVFFVMTVSAAEVAVGLALIVAIFRTKHSIDIDAMNSLKG